MKQGALDLGDGEPESPPDALMPLDGINDLGFDTETTGLRWWGVDRPVGLSYAWRDRDGKLHSRYVPWGHRGGGNHPLERVREWISRELRGKKLRGLNAPFDINHMRAAGHDLAAAGCTFNDVGHNAALLDDHMQPGSFGLEAIAQSELGEGKVVTGIDPEHIADRPAWEIAPYARRDAELVVRINERQQARMAAEDLGRISDLEDRVLPATCEMMWNGARIDVERLRGWERESDNLLTAALMRVHAEVGFHVSPSSPTDLARLFAKLNLQSPDCTCPEGKHREVCTPSYADASLAKLEAASPVIKMLRDTAHLEDLRAKYLVPYLRDVGGDGILRFGLNQLRSEFGGTVSGRYSSSQPIRGEGINVQQVMSNEKHKKLHGDRYSVRELFIPTPGSLLLCSDAKQIEYRIFAHMAASRHILSVYEANPEADFHQIVCDMVQAFRQGFSRKDSKNLNFAILFGAGIRKVAEMLGVDIKTAKALRDAYFEAFPEARLLMDLAQEKAKERGWIKTLFGRRARFHACPKHGWSGSKEPCGTCPRLHKALNSAIQGTAADINKLKLAELYEARASLGFTMRMTIHDEVVGDVPDAEAGRQVAALLDRQSLPLRVPILWDTRTAANWKEAK